MLCMICVVQIQPRKHVLDDADNTAGTLQHELDDTDHTDHTDQEYIFPERSRSWTVAGIDDLSELWNYDKKPSSASLADWMVDTYTQVCKLLYNKSAV